MPLLDTPEGETTEWESQALRAYQRRTLAADALIASVYLSGAKGDGGLLDLRLLRRVGLLREPVGKEKGVPGLHRFVVRAVELVEHLEVLQVLVDLFLEEGGLLIAGLGEVLVQRRQRVADFVSAYNFGRRLKTLKGLTPYEFICKAWAVDPERFSVNPLQQMPGLNI